MFLSFGVHQRNTLQVRFLGGHSVLCMCSLYVCTPYSFSRPISVQSAGLNVLALRIDEVVEKATTTVAVAKVLRCPGFVLKESPVSPVVW